MVSPDDDHMNYPDTETTWPEVDRREHHQNRQRHYIPPSNCADHALNMEFYRTVSTKQNWILGGVAALLACMAYLLTTQISDGKILTTLTVANVQNIADIRELQVNQTRVMESIADFGRWKTQWEAMERFAHGNGVEQHHLNNTK
jgi:hypothetical protein